MNTKHLNKKKIIFFCAEDKGFISHRLILAKKLQQYNYEIYLIARISKYKKILQNNKIKFINFSYNKKQRYSLNIFKIFKRIFFLRKNILKINPNIIHNIGTMPIFYSNFLFKMMFKKKIMIVNTVTGLGSISVQKNLKFFLYLNFLKILLKNSKIILQNRTDYNLFKKNFKKKNKIFLNYNIGINVKNYKIRKSKSNFLKIIMHSRLLKVKGVYEYLKAVKEIKKTNKLIKFYLYGDFDENNPDCLDRKDFLNYKKNLDGYGFKENIEKYLHKYDIACLPSYREGLPKSLIEAALSGLVILTTNTPGCKEVVKNNYNGLFIKKKNVDDLKKKILYLATHRNKLDYFSRNSYNYSRVKFSLSAIIKNLIDIYEK